MRAEPGALYVYSQHHAHMFIMFVGYIRREPFKMLVLIRKKCLYQDVGIFNTHTQELSTQVHKIRLSVSLGNTKLSWTHNSSHPSIPNSGYGTKLAVTDQLYPLAYSAYINGLLYFTQDDIFKNSSVVNEQMLHSSISWVIAQAPPLPTKIIKRHFAQHDGYVKLFTEDARDDKEFGGVNSRDWRAEAKRLRDSRMYVSKHLQTIHALNNSDNNSEHEEDT